MSSLSRTFSKNAPINTHIWTNFRHIPGYLLHPFTFIKNYERSNLQPDLVAGITVAVILLPQAIAFALIAELPPQMGLFAAVVAGFIGALWGSSNQIHTGPTNAISLLVLSSLLTIAEPGTPKFIVAAGVMAVMVGVFQLGMGLARLGVLVNFVSHSVVVGFASGAGVLIAIRQLRPLFGLEVPSHTIFELIHGIALNLFNSHPATTVLGIGTMVLIIALRRISAQLPGALISMVVASIVVFVLGLDKGGVSVIGQLPSSLPPLADLPLFDLDFIAELSTGALAVGAIGLVETTAISRSIAAQTRQRLDSNQEFVGQGLANIAAGFFSGYPVAGSFSRSAVNFKVGAKTPMAALFSAIFVLIAMFTLAPLAAFLPTAALAGVLILTAYGMIDRAEIVRIWQSNRGDAIIMLVTFLGTLFLHIEFAVLLGIMLSFGLYIMKTSVPQVFAVLPDDSYRHFIRRSAKEPCPQLGIIDIMGDLYFGAVNHIEEEIRHHAAKHPQQRYLLLRMHGVHQCDFSGIHALELIVQAYQDRGGDVFFTGVHKSVFTLMRTTGFYEHLGADNFMSKDQAISTIFHKKLDPAVCIYECTARVFSECCNLPMPTHKFNVPSDWMVSLEQIPYISAELLHTRLRNGQNEPIIVDVREPREFKRGHIAQAELVSLPKFFTEQPAFSADRELVFVCQGGRRSAQAANIVKENGHPNKVFVLQGGMLAWENAGFFEAIEV